MTPDELKAARAELGLSGAAFARVFHVTDRSVRAWESATPTNWRINFATAMLIRLAVKFPLVRRELGIPRNGKKGNSKVPPAAA